MSRCYLEDVISRSTQLSIFVYIAQSIGVIIGILLYWGSEISNFDDSNYPLWPYFNIEDNENGTSIAKHRMNSSRVLIKFLIRLRILLDFIIDLFADMRDD